MTTSISQFLILNYSPPQPCPISSPLFHSPSKPIILGPERQFSFAIFQERLFRKGFEDSSPDRLFLPKPQSYEITIFDLICRIPASAFPMLEISTLAGCSANSLFTQIQYFVDQYCRDCSDFTVPGLEQLES